MAKHLGSCGKQPWMMRRRPEVTRFTPTHKGYTFDTLGDPGRGSASSSRQETAFSSRLEADRARQLRAAHAPSMITGLRAA